ncbi:MAG: hypothetical protein ACRC7O_07305 [Fimbriiglobus sp.]
MHRLVNGLVWYAALIAVWLSPLVLTVGFDFRQIDRAQREAVTRVYGKAAFEAGLRVTKHGKLTDGRDADPATWRVVSERSAVPTVVVFFGSGLLADFVLRRYFGGGYRGQEPLISWPKRSGA